MKAYTAQTYALLRIVTGFLLLWHGTQKLFNLPVPVQEGTPAFVVYIAGPIELVAGFLVMIGLLTRPAAFLSSGLMAAAYWMVHSTRGLFPIANNGDLAILYSFTFLFISAYGPGIWSVDAGRGSQ